MRSLHYSILVLLLLGGDRARVASVDQQRHAISDILKSYAEAFTTSSPEGLPTPLYIRIETKNPSFGYTSPKPREVETQTLAGSSEVHRYSSDSTPKGSNVSTNQSEESGEEEEPSGPPDHSIPYSEHEDPKEPQTRPNYTAPGDWAKPPPEKNIPLSFVPTKLYAQVRGTHTVKHVPKEEAIKSAETDEEKENAARLKEVVKVLKANTIYTEEGYEDAAYDHAGQIRDADFHEGFARRLNEEKEKKPPHSKSHKKPRKSKSREYDNFDDDYRDHLDESVDESRTPARTVKSDGLRTLKSALSKSVIDPKTSVQEGVFQLEKDLKEESSESSTVTSDPYSIRGTTYKTAENNPSIQKKGEYETTTEKYEVYTVRSRRPSEKSKSRNYSAKTRKSPNYYSTYKNNDNYNGYSSDSRNVDPLSGNYGSRLWEYYLNKGNQTKGVSVSTERPQLEVTAPVLANPLAVATVNGHGPYLVVVTVPPISRLENEGLGSTIQYIPGSENVTQPTLINSHGHYNPFLTDDTHKVQLRNEHNTHLYSHVVNKPNHIPREYKIADKKMREKSFQFPQLTNESPNQEVDYLQNEKNNYVDDFLVNEKNNYMDYYTVMQPPKVSEALVTYPDYTRGPYSNVMEQWTVTHESEQPIESVPSLVEGLDRPRVEPQRQKRIPVTRLLPPAPLSASEYASFHMRGRRSEPLPHSIMTIVPILEAIHKREHQYNSFPYIFRKKRSLGHSREWEINQRDNRLRNAALKKLEKSESTRNERKIPHKKYPAKFEQLLYAAPHIASAEVDREIQERFKTSSTETSNESKSDRSGEGRHETLDSVSREILDAGSRNSEEVSKEISKETKKKPHKSKNNDKDQSVEVEVPELDFSSVFEEDELESTTRKPTVDTKKYPFYKNDNIFKNSAMKYVINPYDVPRKTLGGMEFYDSRNMECEEIEPNLEKLVPEEEELANKRGPRKSKPRLHGLGDKVDCYKAKYFDHNPLDNPLFIEKEVDSPSPPPELDPKKFASRILELPTEKDEYVVLKGPKNPEEYSRRNRNPKLESSPRSYNSGQNYRYNNDPFYTKRRPSNVRSSKNRRPSNAKLNDENRANPTQRQRRKNLKKSNLKISPAYQRQVYEDVMGTIMDLEKHYKSSVPKRGLNHFYSIPITREYKKEQQNIRNFDSKNRSHHQIGGLIPPPKLGIHSTTQKNNQFLFPNQRYNRHTSNETPTRKFKRSVDGIKESYNTLNKSENVTKKPEKSTFRIVLTTPPTDKFKKKRKAVTIISDETTITPTTQKTLYTIHDRMRRLNNSSEVFGKYDKFVDKINETSALTRRKEPRYNIPSRRNTAFITVNSTSNPIKSESVKIHSQTSTDPTFSGSTLVPVIVKPDKNFTIRIPQESKTRYTKKLLEESLSEEEQDNLNDYNDEINDNKPDDLKHSSIQDLISDKSYLDPKNEKNIEVVTEYTEGIDSQEHKELYDFLKGDPPGYAETFGRDSTTEHNKDQLYDNLQNDETKNNPQNQEIDRIDEDDSKEVYADNDTSDEDSNVSNKNQEENTSANSQESTDEPFVRYSSRPYSPPENFEDYRYSDLGPRVNKPSFYHPPFEIPEYEKLALGKSVDRTDDDFWGQPEETEDHEKYVFPWENDNDEDEEESQHEVALGRYEFPWEKRERKERERRKREKLQKKYGKKFYDLHGYDDENEEASNAKPIYVSLKKKHWRGKKDVADAEGSSIRSPSTKFSSRYKSGTIKVPLDDEEIVISVANNDEIKQSIIDFIENITPKINTSEVRRNNLNDSLSIKNNTHSPSSSSNKNNLALKIETTTSKALKSGKTTTVSPVVNSRSKRTRIRSRKINIENTSTKVKPLNETLQETTTPVSKIVRRRGRSRDTVSSSTTVRPITTSSKPNTRRRSRLNTSTATPAITSSSSGRNVDKRRRLSRTQTSTEKSTSPKSTQNVSTTSSTIPTSTGRTIEHHSRVSKEEIITKTIYPDEDDDDEEDDDAEDKSSRREGAMQNTEKKPLTYAKIKRRGKPDSQEKVEKVTITMEETPDLVYRTKEIDKDGVKGKFITITANNNSVTPSKRNDGEMEEMKRRMSASYDSVIRNKEELVDEPTSAQAAENYIVGNLLQKLPLPAIRRSTVTPKEDTGLSDQRASEEDDSDSIDTDDNKEGDKKSRCKDDDDDDGDDDDDDDDGDSEADESRDNREKHKKEETENERNANKKVSAGIILEPNNRPYFYVERR